jgi:hypothetical protein
MDRIWLTRTEALALALLATMILFAINYFESAFPHRSGPEPCYTPEGHSCLAM